MNKKFSLPETKDINGVQIFSVGKWNGDEYTKDDIDSIVSAFNATKNEIRPYLKLGHDDGQKLVQKDGFPAMGWIENLRCVGETLVADFKKLPSKIYDLIVAGAYSRVSSEIFFNIKIKDKTYSRVLKAVAILGGDTPAVQNLSDIL